MTNLERLTSLESMARLIQGDDEGYADQACRANMDKNGGTCPFGDNGPEGDECLQCNREWLMTEVD